LPVGWQKARHLPLAGGEFIEVRSDPVMGTMQNRLFFGDFVRLHILYLATRKPVCGVGVVAELDRHSYGVCPGKVYPVLHALEQAGYLASRSVVVCG
jgi:hypothetical protein